MTKRQATGTDAKELFKKYFGGMIESSAHTSYDGESTKREDFTDLSHIDSGDLRDLVMGFSIEFMNMFNLGIRQRGNSFFIDGTGKAGRPKGSKNRQKCVEQAVETLVAHSPKSPEEHAPTVSIEEEEIFGRCPKCKSLTMHEPHAKGYVRCNMCNHVNKREEIEQ